jgi:small subunit ribosomal protein S5
LKKDKEKSTYEADKNPNNYEEKLLRINRVSKTVKGGRKISFSVLAAVGDKNGKIGIGLGKANGVPEAIKKAIANAKKDMVTVSLKGTTVPHETVGEYLSTKVVIRPASEGTGVIAGSATREILDLVGVHNVLTKIMGSRNKNNVARATIEGLKNLRTAEQIARLRGKTVEEILG